MKLSPNFIFFAIVFTIYGLFNTLIFLRAWQALPKEGPFRLTFLFVFLPIVLAFITGRFLERIWQNGFTEILVWVGSFYLAAMFYFLLAILLLDLARLINHFIPFFPRLITENYQLAKFYAFFSVFCLVLLVIAIGHINALNPKVTSLSLEINKSGNNLKTLNVVAASDVHLGTIFGYSRFQKLVERINSLNPDIIIFAGDLFDEDIASVKKNGLGKLMEQLHARFGVYAITGNHEYIGGATAAIEYLTQHKITVLRDTAVKINDSFYLIGREDRDKTRFTGTKRKDIKDLIGGLDSALPWILLDHQPFYLNQASENKIDFQISGHTHHGQIWPFNYITQKVYEVSTGYLLKDSTHIYVSTGYGTWGPPVRLGNRPELMNFKLNFIK